MKRAVIIGSGAGGATAAKELQGKFEVTVLEAGGAFHPFTTDLSIFEKIKKTGLLFDEKLIQLIFPYMKVGTTSDKTVWVKGKGHGGTTTISAGNAIRKDDELKAIGVNLEAEFQEIFREIPISTEHTRKWHEKTREVFEICRDLNLHPTPTPKMVYPARCTGCGKCILGCRFGAKWDSRQYLNQAIEKGARLISNCQVQKVVTKNGKALGVQSTQGFLPADLVILAAGGLGTPVILQNSGFECRPNLFVDPVLCVATRVQASRQQQEIPMPFIVQGENFIISPYFDFLSFFFNRKWKYPAGDTYSLMIKLADSNSGNISQQKVQKELTSKDQQSLKEGVRICAQIFRRWGIKADDLFLGTINAGHPGGMLPLTEREAETFHHDQLPENLYVADATLLPKSLGNPPILTIAAMAKRVSKHCLQCA